MARAGFDMSIDLQKSDALLGLRDLQFRQIPFATALALTRTAQASQGAVKESLPSRFTIRNNFIERGTRIERATKRDQESAVFWRAPGGSSRRIFAEALARQEEGGLKNPRKKYLAIPRNVKRTKGGKISKRDLPAAALKKKRTFIGPTKTAGTKGIYQRVGKKRTPIKMLYFLTPRDADIDERFEFVETAETMALKVYDKEFGKAFAKAIRTAR